MTVIPLQIQQTVINLNVDDDDDDDDDDVMYGVTFLTEVGVIAYFVFSSRRLSLRVS
jgi:hypothetical protein